MYPVPTVSAPPRPRVDLLPILSLNLRLTLLSAASSPIVDSGSSSESSVTTVVSSPVVSAVAVVVVALPVPSPEDPV